MILRPPRSTRTDTLFPYTTLFRSVPRRAAAEGRGQVRAPQVAQPVQMAEIDCITVLRAGGEVDDPPGEAGGDIVAAHRYGVILIGERAPAERHASRGGGLGALPEGGGPEGICRGASIGRAND